MEVVWREQKACNISFVLGLDPLDQCLGGDAFGLGAQHDRGAMGVIGPDPLALIAGQALIAHPDIALNVLEQMPDVQGPVGVG